MHAVQPIGLDHHPAETRIDGEASELAADVDLDRTAILLDVDGTLIEIAETPMAVRVPPSLKHTLAKLRDRLGGALSLVSGRPVAQLDELFSPARLPIVGRRQRPFPPEPLRFVGARLVREALIRRQDREQSEWLAEIVNESGKGKNITASVIVPSIMDTPVNRISMPKADFDTWVPPSAVADSVAYLLSEAGSHLRETVLKIYNNA